MKSVSKNPYALLGKFNKNYLSHDKYTSSDLDYEVWDPQNNTLESAAGFSDAVVEDRERSTDQEMKTVSSINVQSWPSRKKEKTICCRCLVM